MNYEFLIIIAFIAFIAFIADILVVAVLWSSQARIQN